MVFWMAGAVGLAIAYLFGAMPTGYLAGRLLKGIDIREHGSRSTGATNVLRTLGKWPALAVLLVDVLKGVAAIMFAGCFFPCSAHSFRHGTATLDRKVSCRGLFASPGLPRCWGMAVRSG